MRRHGSLDPEGFRYILNVKRMDDSSTKLPLKPEVAIRGRHVQHGIVYTRPWVVDLVLDLAGYKSDRNLVDSIAVEPSCGNGGFLEAMIRRLSSSCRQQERPLQDCERSLLAFDLNPDAVLASRMRAASVLVDCGWGTEVSRAMAQAWVREADFLLDPDLDLIALGGGVDFVVGNPPYVRLESMDRAVAETYRKRYKTMSGRADLYVGFFERALEMLAPDGICAFICADRWMLNQYGARLRNLVTSDGFSVETVVEMHQADAFQDEVLAYPAVTTIRRGAQGKVLVANVGKTTGADVGDLAEAARRHRAEPQPGNATGSSHPARRDARYVVVDEWFRGSAPWPCVSPERLKLLKWRVILSSARGPGHRHEGGNRGRDGSGQGFPDKGPEPGRGESLATPGNGEGHHDGCYGLVGSIFGKPLGGGREPRKPPTLPTATSVL